MLKSLAVLVFILAALAVYALKLLNPSSPPAPQLFEVSRTDLKTELLLSGTLVNEQIVSMTALLNGQLLKVPVNEGDVVKQGDVLAQIDDRTSQALLSKSQAATVAAEQNLQTTQLQLARFERLFKSGNATEQALEDARSKMQTAEAALNGRQADTQIASLEASNTVIRAPFDAIVIESNTGVGQWVEAGTKLFVLASRTAQAIEAFVSTADLANVRIGQPAKLNSDAWPERSWGSHISWLAPSISSSANAPSDSFAIRLPVGEEAPRLLLGQELDVTLNLKRLDDVLSLPISALQEATAGEFYAWRKTEDGVMKVRVETGLSTSDNIEIINGLSDGDIVVSPNETEFLKTAVDESSTAL